MSLLEECDIQFKIFSTSFRLYLGKVGLTVTDVRNEGSRLQFMWSANPKPLQIKSRNT